MGQEVRGVLSEGGGERTTRDQKIPPNHSKRRNQDQLRRSSAEPGNDITQNTLIKGYN